MLLGRQLAGRLLGVKQVCLTSALAPAEKTANHCACQPSWSETTSAGITVGSGGGCADDEPRDSTPGWCYVIPETCSSPPQRRHGQPWDVCVGACSPVHAPQAPPLQQML